MPSAAAMPRPRSGQRRARWHSAAHCLALWVSSLVHRVRPAAPGTGGAAPASVLVPIRARAARRQPNSCCGLSPCRRATSDTFAPGARLYRTIWVLASVDHRRRRPLPVISSIRRTSPASPGSFPLGSSVRSSVWSNRSFMPRHHATAGANTKCGAETPLTHDPSFRYGMAARDWCAGGRARTSRELEAFAKYMVSVR